MTSEERVRQALEQGTPIGCTVRLAGVERKFSARLVENGRGVAIEVSSNGTEEPEAEQIAGSWESVLDELRAFAPLNRWERLS